MPKPQDCRSTWRTKLAGPALASLIATSATVATGPQRPRDPAFTCVSSRAATGLECFDSMRDTDSANTTVWAASRLYNNRDVHKPHEIVGWFPTPGYGQGHCRHRRSLPLLTRDDMQAVDERSGVHNNTGSDDADDRYGGGGFYTPPPYQDCDGIRQLLERRQGMWWILVSRTTQRSPWWEVLAVSGRCAFVIGRERSQRRAPPHWGFLVGNQDVHDILRELVAQHVDGRRTATGGSMQCTTLASDKRWRVDWLLGTVVDGPKTV
ncbi:hypothetical protein VTK73DRAFT_9698 [Phialemonium thermophilum]|uniref:Ecp2 effector protein-like domain-containing protein n=1 Tax=Phialemonium thermophilum TaxID=223376 RepID=A0ABR3W0T7_9PEZI